VIQGREPVGTVRDDDGVGIDTDDERVTVAHDCQRSGVERCEDRAEVPCHPEKLVVHV
jgi:hypothetical protein